MDLDSPHLPDVWRPSRKDGSHGLVIPILCNVTVAYIILAQYMSSQGIQVYHAPLETPEAIGRVERHGGVLKGMLRKVISQTQARGALFHRHARHDGAPGYRSMPISIAKINDD